MWRLIFVAFLVAHGLIHLGYVSPAPTPAPGAPAWPFNLEVSWALRRLGARRGAMVAAGRALVVVSVAGFAAAGLGLLAGAAWWAPAAIVSSAVSLVLLLVWFHRWLAVGVALDLALIGALSSGLAP